MKVNEAGWDRIVRLILAVILGYLGFFQMKGTTAGIILDIIAVILLVTAVVGFCPLYSVLGFATKKE